MVALPSASTWRRWILLRDKEITDGIGHAGHSRSALVGTSITQIDVGLVYLMSLESLFTPNKPSASIKKALWDREVPRARRLCSGRNIPPTLRSWGESGRTLPNTGSKASAIQGGYVGIFSAGRRLLRFDGIVQCSTMSHIFVSRPADRQVNVPVRCNNWCLCD
jgi:hypothetical protein